LLKTERIHPFLRPGQLPRPTKNGNRKWYVVMTRSNQDRSLADHDRDEADQRQEILAKADDDLVQHLTRRQRVMRPGPRSDRGKGLRAGDFSLKTGSCRCHRAAVERFLPTRLSPFGVRRSRRPCRVTTKSRNERTSNISRVTASRTP